MSNSFTSFLSIHLRSVLCHSDIWETIFLNLFSLRPFAHVNINHVILLYNFYWRRIHRAAGHGREGSRPTVSWLHNPGQLLNHSPCLSSDETDSRVEHDDF